MANAAPVIDANFHDPGVDPFEVVCSTDDEQEWLAARQTGIGASEIASVLGMTTWSSPLKLYAEKVGAVPRDELDAVEAVRWGKRLEPVIAQVFAETTGRRIWPSQVLLRSKAHPWALATLDYWVSEGDNNNTWPLEIKNVTAYKAEDWENGVPEYYRAQVHQQMLVTGAQRATSAALLGGNRLIWCDVERDEQLIRKITYHGELFWERVKRRTPPEVDGSEATRSVLHALFPEDDNRTVVLPMALAEIVDEWRDAKADEKAAKERIRAAENQIKATLGEHYQGVFPGGDAVTWSTEHVAEHVVKAHSKRVLRYHPSKLSKGR